MIKVLAFTKYGTMAASTRQRILLYKPYLQAHGVDIELAPLLDNEYLVRMNNGVREPIGARVRAYLRRFTQLFMSRRYDLLWVHYELFPYLPGFLERLAFVSGRPVMVDMDDAIFHVYDRHPNSLVRRILAGKLESLLLGAAACTCGNGYLKAYAERFCAHTRVIPTVVDTQVYTPKKEWKKGDVPVIGWIGSPTTWQNVVPLLPMLLSKVKAGSARFRVVGAGPESLGIGGVESIPWTDSQEVAAIQSMDIGIMPLLDLPFQRGKCGYKLIQYMACGLPVVASPVGVNSEIVSSGENGFLATTLDEWSVALDKLLADAMLRRKMGAEGRDIVEKRYSLVVHQTRLLETMLNIAGHQSIGVATRRRLSSSQVGSSGK